jgi:hypothetical protein
MAEQTSAGGCRRSGGKCSAPRASALTIHSNRQNWSSNGEPRANEAHDGPPAYSTATRTRTNRHTTDVIGPLLILEN